MTRPMHIFAVCVLVLVLVSEATDAIGETTRALVLYSRVWRRRNETNTTRGTHRY